MENQIIKTFSNCIFMMNYCYFLDESTFSIVLRVSMHGRICYDSRYCVRRTYDQLMHNKLFLASLGTCCVMFVNKIRRLIRKEINKFQ